MDLSFFLTIQTPQTGKEQPLFPGLGKGAFATGDGSAAKDFDLFFKTLLEGGFEGSHIEKEIKVSDSTANDPLDYQSLNSQLSESVASLEALFSADAPTPAKIVEIQDFLASHEGRIVIPVAILEEKHVALPDQTKLALLDRLIGTPLKIKLPDTPLETSTKTAAAKPEITSPFANTEATLDGRALFEKILQNLKQDEGIQISVESIIAAGLSPQEFEQILDIPAVTLDTPTAAPEPGVVSDDLIALLGLVQNLPVQTALPPQKGSDPINQIELWVQDEDGEVTFYKDIRTLGELKAAMNQAPQAIDKSKAGQMMSGTANQNQSVPVIPVLIHMAGNEPTTMEWFDAETQQWTSVPSLPSALNGTNLTSTLVQAPHAHTAHPATQMLAVSIQKNASSGPESRNWTLQLNPPDLGKVEVQLTFNKDKTVKAQMLVEKPETWAMLQRDAQILERALQNAGLDIEGGGIGFELAENGHDFNQNGSHDGQGADGNGSGSGEEMEIIETTMTWFVDPHSGLQRYDLVV